MLAVVAPNNTVQRRVRLRSDNARHGPHDDTAAMLTVLSASSDTVVHSAAHSAMSVIPLVSSSTLHHHILHLCIQGLVRF